MRKVDLAAIIAVNIEKENQRLKAEQESHRLSANRTAERLEQIAERKRLTTQSDRDVKCREDMAHFRKLIDRVAPLMPALCREMSESNGLRAIFSFYRSDCGPWSCQVQKDGKKLFTLSNNSLAERVQAKEHRTARLKEKLEADGWNCATEEDMMAEILDLRSNLKEYKSALAELRKYQE